MILLLGGCGFLGRSLSDALISRGHAVKIFDQHDSIAQRRREEPRAVYYSGNFATGEFDRSLFEGVTSVIHLVHSTIPSTSMESVPFDAQSNILPSIQLLEAIRHSEIRRFVYISSGGTVYGIPARLPAAEGDPENPISAYGVSKLAIEKYVEFYSRIFGLEGVVVRLGNPYGPHQLEGTAVGVIANILLRISRGTSVEIWGDGHTVRDYIYIDDVSDAICQFALRRDVPSGVYNLGGGVGYSLREVLMAVQNACGVNIAVTHYPARQLDVPAVILDISRIKERLDWYPKVTLSEGICRMWNALCHKAQ